MEYDKRLFDSLQAISNKVDDLNKQLEVAQLPITSITDINKQLSRFNPISVAFLAFKKIIEEAKAIENNLEKEKDQQILELMRLELDELKTKATNMQEELKILLIPKDPNDEKNVIIEIRPAAGGDESSIFTADLFEVYKRYFLKQKWKINIIDISINAFGYDYIYFNVVGKSVYSKMKFESGVHRVQRIPATESKGRVHTSTITVAVMPEIDEVDFKLNPVDVRKDVFRSGGAGGQHVNRTESAVRLTHLPTGIVVACDSERSQIENYANAKKLLIAKIWDKMEKDRMSEIELTRRKQVGTGERSEKIRTYNYPQNRISDHRINLNLNKLDYIMEGNLDEIIDNLIVNEQKEKIKQLVI